MKSRSDNLTGLLKLRVLSKGGITGIGGTLNIGVQNTYKTPKVESSTK